MCVENSLWQLSRSSHSSSWPSEYVCITDRRGGEEKKRKREVVTNQSETAPVNYLKNKLFAFWWLLLSSGSIHLFTNASWLSDCVDRSGPKQSSKSSYVMCVDMLQLWKTWTGKCRHFVYSTKLSFHVGCLLWSCEGCNHTSPVWSTLIKL